MRVLESWERKQDKSAKRREGFEYFGIGFGSLVMQIVLLFQFGAGGFRNFPIANYIANLLILTILLSTLTLIIYPKWYFKGVKKIGHFIGKYTFNQIANLLLLLIYYITLPYARVFARRKYLSQRPEHASWVSSNTNWKISTWVKKPSIKTRGNKTNPIFRLLGIFIAQRNWFLLIVTFFLLLISMFIIFVQSSAVAPFIYTLF